MLCGITNFITVSSFPISKQNINPNSDIVADSNPFLPLEDAIFRFYFAEHIKGVLPLSKENIKILAACLKKMLVLDPRNRAHAHELLLDPWFTKSEPVESLALSPP